MTVKAVLAAAATLVALNSTTIDGQALRIGSEVSCTSCSISLEKISTIANVEFPWPGTMIARDSTGAIYLFDREGVLKAFGKDGRFLRQIGRRGGGPGEYEGPRNILASRDGSIHVLDAQLSRRSMFSRDGLFLGSTSIRLSPGMGKRAVLLPDGQTIVNVRPTPSGGAMYVLQRIDQNGNTTRLFDETKADDGKSWLHERLLWARPTGELLVARPHTFDIDVYAKGLETKNAIVRIADWIPSREPDEQPGDGVHDKPMTPRLFAIWEDAQGLLWLHMLVPSKLWKPGPPMKRATPLAQDAYAALAARPRVETIIEVLDLQAQGVLARSRFEGGIGIHFGGGYFARQLENAAGEPSLEISRVRLNR